MTRKAPETLTLPFLDDGKWVANSERAVDLLGLIPYFVQPDDPRPATEQINERYAHGGGWSDYNLNWELNEDGSLAYHDSDPEEEDEHYEPLAWSTLRGEKIIVYAHGWTAVVKTDGTFEVARLD